MTDKLTRTIYHQYLKAQKRAVRRCENIGLHDVARSLAECDIFNGTESIDELMRLMFSSQGVEFMMSFNFPDAATCRKFKSERLERYNVYIDAGNITLANADNVFLIGDTTAKLDYTKTARCSVYLMHGASAVVSARGYSVVHIEHDRSSIVNVRKSDNAIIV